MPKQAGEIFNDDTFVYLDDDKIYPSCGGELEHMQVFRLSEYMKDNPNVYVAYFGKDHEETAKLLCLAESD